MKMKAPLPLALLPFSVASSSFAPTATLNSGPIFGAATNLPGAISPVNKFLGIPYAAPPERFSLSRPPEKWTTPKNTTAFRESCVQYVIDSDIGPGADIVNDLWDSHPPESEDCLYMNAFAPTTPSPPDGRPVVVFIHGGGWQMSNGLVDLSGFAGYEDVVAFTFNYRTNVLGFPNAREIPPNERNLGLLDQRLALEWVQANANAFGGDPSRVTIWGESAGSMSVDIHLQSYANASRLPFRAGIMSSGQYSFGMLSISNNPQDTKGWDDVAQAVGCPGNNTLSCMRGLPVKELLKGVAKAGPAFLPITDNVTVISGRGMAWREGRIAKVPVLATTLAQEGRSLVNRNISMERFLEVYLSPPLVTKELQKTILSFYREGLGLKTDFDVAAAIYTDFFWQCPHQILANVSASIENPMWRGYLNFSISDILPDKFQWLGKFHGADVALLFLSPTFDGDLGDRKLTPQLYTFANYFRGVIGKFVRNPDAGPGWPVGGSRYAPFDVASLGDLGDKTTAGASPVNQTELDASCVLFQDLYLFFEKYLG